MGHVFVHICCLVCRAWGSDNIPEWSMLCCKPRSAPKKCAPATAFAIVATTTGHTTEATKNLAWRWTTLGTSSKIANGEIGLSAI